MKKFKISDKCMSCGLCFSITDLIVEDEQGFAKPDSSKFIAEDFAAEADAIVKQCPAGAISIEEVSNTKFTGKAAIEDLTNALKTKFEQIPELKIDSSNFYFDASKYKIKPQSSPLNLDDENYIDYKYSTKSAANNAAVREFEQKTYSRLDSMIRGVLGEYKVDILSKYYTFDDNCPYVQNNHKYEKVLNEIYAEAKFAGIQLPNNFTEFYVVPHKNGYGKYDAVDDTFYDILKTFELSVGFDSVKYEFEHNEVTYKKSQYLDMIYIDYESQFVSSGFFGDKYKNVYGYSQKDMDDAVNEFISDINFSFSMANNKISNTAYKEVKSFVMDYNIAVKKETEKKIKILLNSKA